VITFCNDTENQSSFAKMRQQYPRVMSRFFYVLDRVREEEAETLDALNPLYSKVQPLPIKDRIMYNKICFGKMGDIVTKSLIAPLMPHPSLAGAVEGRTLGWMVKKRAEFST
jgi:hypothetical protein